MQTIAELQNLPLQEHEAIVGSLRSWTDQELLDYLGMPHGATDDELRAIALGGSLQEATWE